jgi:hypothetical protein
MNFSQLHLKRAEEAARELHSIMSSSSVTQLLQDAPPASLTTDQDEQLRRCFTLLSQLETLIETGEPVLRSAVLTAILQQHAAGSAGSLVAWAAQRPEQLMSLTLGEVLRGTGTATTGWSSSTAALGWAAGLSFLRCAADAVSKLDAGSAAASQMTADMTQQLHQSGGWGRCCCTVGADNTLNMSGTRCCAGALVPLALLCTSPACTHQPLLNCTYGRVRFMRLVPLTHCLLLRPVQAVSAACLLAWRPLFHMHSSSSLPKP